MVVQERINVNIIGVVSIKHNIFWPVPNSAITANKKGVLRQNYGYDGYDASVAMWTKWEDAVADEDKID